MMRRERQAIERRKWALEKKAIRLRISAHIRAENARDKWTRQMRANAPRKGRWVSSAGANISYEELEQMGIYVPSGGR